jgi:hypothetical protein
LTNLPVSRHRSLPGRAPISSVVDGGSRLRAELTKENPADLIARVPGPDPGTVQVTFIVEPIRRGSGQRLAVVGEFNEWDPTRHPLVPGGDGRWRAGVVLDAGRRYEFRYLSDTGQWFDEPDADDWADNGAGQHNSIVQV